jgi:hypothetical protein
MDQSDDRQGRVEAAMERELPPTPLPVPPPPSTLPDLGTKSPDRSQPSEQLSSPFRSGNKNISVDGTQELPGTPEVENRAPQEQPTVSTPLYIPEGGEQRELDFKSPPAPSPDPIAPSPILPTADPNPKDRESGNGPNETSHRVTRSMSRASQYEPERRFKRNICPPQKLNLWSEYQELEVPYCLTLEKRPFGLDINCPTFSYLLEALSETIPPVHSASTLVSADAFKASVGDPDTLSYDEAMADKEFVDEWRRAAKKEIETLESHGTWESQRCVRGNKQNSTGHKGFQSQAFSRRYHYQAQSSLLRQR